MVHPPLLLTSEVEESFLHPWGTGNDIIPCHLIPRGKDRVYCIHDVFCQSADGVTLTPEQLAVSDGCFIHPEL